MAVKIIQETDDLVLGREQDGFRALGICAALAALAPEYANDDLFWFAERFRAGIEKATYGILYERSGKKATLFVPVGFIFWGLLNPPNAELFKMRRRALTAAELVSGKNLWVIDICAQFGHSAELVDMFDKTFVDHAQYKATRWKDGKIVVQVKNNKFAKKMKE